MSKLLQYQKHRNQAGRQSCMASEASPLHEIEKEEKEHLRALSKTHMVRCPQVKGMTAKDQDIRDDQ